MVKLRAKSMNALMRMLTYIKVIDAYAYSLIIKTYMLIAADQAAKLANMQED